MSERSTLASFYRWTVLVSLFLFSAMGLSAQDSKSATNYPSHLPYRFANFVWWNDEDLRAMLKRRIPGLGDEIAPTASAEGRMRDALTELMKEKGIEAHVLSVEVGLRAGPLQPSSPLPFGFHVPPSSGPGVEFSLVTPQVLIEKVLVQSATEDVAQVLQPVIKRYEGRPYNAIGDAVTRFQLIEELKQKGYIDAQLQLSRQAPRNEGERYLVNLSISVDAGPRYHISSITADGGPLLAGRDLSPFFGLKAGDVPSSDPFAVLAGNLLLLYWHSGYADVEINDEPVPDRAHALVTYHLDVIPGPVYHLRSLTIHKLDATQENRVKELIGMQAGDIFDMTAITGLNHKLAAEPSLRACGFTFSAVRDKAAAAVDLTLDFYSKNGESKVTTQ
jgi:outer membrane translocation and assembly module TamA